MNPMESFSFFENNLLKVYVENTKKIKEHFEI